MTNLLSQVTPLTKGLLWFTNGEITPEKAYYKDIDYLLNGLLTATLKSTASDGSHVLISENFGESFYVIVGHGVSEKALSNYFELIKPQMSEEKVLLVIDEANVLAGFKKIIPAEIQSKIQTI